MKKIFTMMLLALVCGMALQAQETDYQPLVREAVKWVNHSQFIYGGDNQYFGPVETYQYELKGDTAITTPSGTHTYKIVQGAYQVFMRESDKKVYLLDLQEAPDEFVLYDFSRPDTAFVSGPGGVKTFEVSGVVEIEGKPCRVYKDTEQYDYFNWGYLVESVGLVSHFDGDLIHPRWARVAGGEYYYGLDHVEDMEGNIIYKSPWYKDPSDVYHLLVRKGIRWIYQEKASAEDGTTDIHYYALEIAGDTIINTTNGRWQYFNCYKYPFNKATASSAVNFAKMSPIAYLKEASRKVFCLDSLTVMSHGWYDELTEPILYDFSSTRQALFGDIFDGTTRTFVFAGYVDVSGQECPAFTDEEDFSFGHLVQSIGFVSSGSGDLLGATRESLAGEGRECGLSHVLDAAGNIIYRGPNYRFFASDINGDNKVDISDVNEVINVMLGKSTTLADVTGDGKVDISDVNAVINVMLGK